MKKGALWGLVVGVIALAKVYLITSTCLPYLMSEMNSPWFCERSTLSAYQYLAFPVNLLTNDLSQAVYLLPLTIIFYVLVGALIGSAFGRKS